MIIFKTKKNREPHKITAPFITKKMFFDMSENTKSNPIQQQDGVKKYLSLIIKYLQVKLTAMPYQGDIGGRKKRIKKEEQNK